MQKVKSSLGADNYEKLLDLLSLLEKEPDTNSILTILSYVAMTQMMSYKDTAKILFSSFVILGIAGWIILCYP